MIQDSGAIIIEILILVFTSIGIILSLFILSLIFYYRHQYPINPSTILICNTYISIIFSCLTICDMLSRTLYGHLYPNVNFNDWWCYVRAYLLQMALASIYFSYLLQAIYRFFRVVMFKYRQLQKFRFILQLIILQWLAVALLFLPLPLLNLFHYLPTDFYCQTPLTHIFATFYSVAIIYYIPMLTTGIFYTILIYYVKHSNHLTNQENRQRSNQRDLLVLRRIIYVVSLLLILFLPTSILWIDYMRTGYLHPLIYHFEWLSFSVLLTIVSVISTFVTPQLHQLMMMLWRKHRQIQPMVVLIPQNGIHPQHTET